MRKNNQNFFSFIFSKQQPEIFYGYIFVCPSFQSFGTLCDGLPSWSKQQFGSVSKGLEQLRAQLEEAKNDPSSFRDTIRSITDQMDELLYISWRDDVVTVIVDIMWLKEGDRNVSYFHPQTIWRARKNKIYKTDEEGRWLVVWEKGCDACVNHYIAI